MIVDRYYYHQLNKQEQVIYKVFYDGVMAHQDIIPIPIRGKLSKDTFHRIFMAMTRDNPLIYYLNQSACNCATDLFGNLAICPQYFFSRDKVREYNRKIEKEVNHLAEVLKLTEGSDYEKEQKVHDWICRNISYDKDGADLSKLSRVIVSHNILGVFAYHRAQCEGIAKAVKVLLNSVDVRCIVVTGTTGKCENKVPHAWNLVNIEGQPYHLDVTWDIGAIVPAMKQISYDYFNLSDKLISQSHKADCSLPQCNSLQHNYFTVNKWVFQIQSHVLAYIKRKLNTGQFEFYFRVEGKIKISETVDEICRVISSVLREQGITEKRYDG